MELVQFRTLSLSVCNTTISMMELNRWVLICSDSSVNVAQQHALKFENHLL